MRTRSTLVLAVAAVAVAGCARTASVADAGDSPTGTASSTSGATTKIVAQAVVSGYVRVYGGPMNPTTGQAAATGAPSPGQQVTIVDAAGHKTSTTSNSTGRFTFRLPPGTYQLACSGEAKDLVLRPGATVEADCPVDVP